MRAVRAAHALSGEGVERGHDDGAAGDGVAAGVEGGLTEQRGEAARRLRHAAVAGAAGDAGRAGGGGHVDEGVRAVVQRELRQQRLPGGLAGGGGGTGCHGAALRV